MEFKLRTGLGHKRRYGEISCHCFSRNTFDIKFTFCSKRNLLDKNLPYIFRSFVFTQKNVQPNEICLLVSRHIETQNQRYGELHRLDKTVCVQGQRLGTTEWQKEQRINFVDSFEDECYLTQQLLCLQPIPQNLASIYITHFISLFLDKHTTRKPNCLQKYILHFLVFIFQSCLPYVHLFFSKSLSILSSWHSPKPVSTVLSLTR